MGVDVFTEPETSREEIFRATYEALQTQGIGELSIQGIADRASLGKSTIYHHFDSKDELLAAFTAAFMAEYVDAFLLELEGDILEMLERSLDLLILGESDGVQLDDLLEPGLSICYLQLRAQGVNDERYREALGEADAIARQRLAALVQTGVGQGVFRDDVDPERVAATLLAFLESGLLFRKTSDDTEWLGHVRASADEYVEGLVAEDVSW